MKNAGVRTGAWSAFLLALSVGGTGWAQQPGAGDDPGLKPTTPAPAAPAPAPATASPAVTAPSGGSARGGGPAAPAPAAPAGTAPSSVGGNAPSALPPSGSAPSAGPGATAPAVPASPSGEPPPTTGASYTVRLHDLERRVNELKEQIFRSKARLNLLKETVLGGTIAGSRAVFVHRNEMGSTYVLIKLVYALDGAEIFSKQDDSGHLGDNQEFEIFNGSIVSGNHSLSVVMVYQGNGYGVFSYLKGYKFTVKNTYTFTAAEGKQTQIKVVGYEKGNALTTDPKDRPAVDFRVNVVSDNSAAPSAAKK